MSNNFDRKKVMNEFGRVLARNIPVLSRLERYGGLENFELVSMNPHVEHISAEYTARATTSWVYNHLKKSLVSAGVIGEKDLDVRFCGSRNGEKLLYFSYDVWTGYEVTIAVRKPKN